MSDQQSFAPPTSPAQPPPPAEPKTPIYRRKWFAPVVALLLGIGLGSASAGGGDDTTATVAEPAPTVTVEVEVEGDAPPAETVTVEGAVPADVQASIDTRSAELDQRSADLDAREAAVTGQEEAAAAGTFPGDGTFLVGTDIQPGTYRSAAPSSGNCYYARLSEVSGSGIDGIITNNNSAGPSVVAIEPSDVAFQVSGCEEWTLVQ